MDRIHSFSCDSFMADRMGLDGTMLHYLAVRKAMVNLHRLIHSKITLTYSLTWQTDRCTPRRMAFKALLNAKAKKLPERAPTKKQLHVLSIIDQLRAWAHRRSAYTQLSPLYPSLYPYVTHVMNYSRPSTDFPYCKRQKAGWGLGTRLLIH